MRTLEHQVTYAQELSMLRHHEQTLRLTWQLLPQVATAAMLHNRVVAYLAYSLDQLKVFDAAIVAYDNLIGQLPPQHPGSVQLQIQRAIAQLQLEQLIDADDTLRRMRHMADTIKHTAVGASYRLAGLLQQVRTHHFAEAIEESGGLLEDLRPLGVEAAYGQALMALCYHQHGGAEGAGGGGAQNSRLWWSRATLLMPPATLVDRFDELGTMVVKP